MLFQVNKKIEILKVIGDESRLRILNLLIKNNEGICVCELMYSLLLHQYRVSKALGILKKAGLLEIDKQGLWVYYKLNMDNSINKDVFKFLSNFLKGNIFKNDEERLNDRLLLRKNNNCVVGILPENELHEIIRAKKNEVNI